MTVVLHVADVWNNKPDVVMSCCMMHNSCSRIFRNSVDLTIDDHVNADVSLPHLLEAVALLCIPGCDSNVVQQAEAHWLVGGGVMARWSGYRVCSRNLSGDGALLGGLHHSIYQS